MSERLGAVPVAVPVNGPAEAGPDPCSIDGMIASERKREAAPFTLDWSGVRSVLAQGAAIQQDYAAGKYRDYEEYSARLDAAARERIDDAALAEKPQEEP